MEKRIAIIRGDGIGPEIMTQAIAVLDAVAAKFQLPVLARLPVDPNVAEAFDHGMMESVDTAAMADVVSTVEKI